MSCNSTNFIEYYQGDNQPIKVTITDQNGDRIPNLQTDLTEINFQAKNQDNTSAIDLTLTGGKITIANEIDGNGNEQDVVTISPLITDTDITPGTYPVFMRLSLQSPTRQFHVEMFIDGIPLKEVVILQSGIS